MRLDALEAALSEGRVPDGIDPLAARALRRELALLRRHPAEALSVLEKWLRWSPRGDLGMWIAELERQWSARRPGGRRARWLRPPPIGLDHGPTYELATPRCKLLAVSSGPLSIALATGDGPARWVPETGEVTGGEVAGPTPRAEIALRGNGWGARAVYLNEQKIGDVQVPDDGTVTGHAVCGDRLVVCGCGDEYWDGYVHIYALPSMRLLRAFGWPRVVWDARLVGRWLVGHSDERIIWDAETGDPITTIEGKGALEISPDGDWLIESAGGCTRCWPWPGSRGRIEVPRAIGFEPRFVWNGKRLIAGQTLYDGERGVRIADLDFDRVSRLEGGPPPGWLLEAGGRLITCDGTFRGWELERGEPLRGPGDTRFAQWSRVALSPSGRRFAYYRAPAPVIQIFDLDRGEVIDAIDAGRVEHVRFVSETELDFSEPARAASGDRPAGVTATLGAVALDGGAAHVTASPELVRHPTRAIWAGRGVHVALE